MLIDMAARRGVLAIENEPGAGPEKFHEWLSDANLEVEICRPHAGDSVPRTLGHGGLLVLGGEMGAGDDHMAPWLAPVRSLLACATAGGRPVLGICLGAQLLAAACGGLVEPSTSGGELGLCTIDLNEQSRVDALFGGLDSPALTVQWHVDEITRLPPRAVLLASSPRCAVQAFRIGTCAWGVQFHPEVSASVLRSWASAAAPSPARREEIEEVIAQVAAAEHRLFESWRGLAERFAAVVSHS